MDKLSDLPRTDRPLNWAIYRDGPRPRPRHDRRASARAMASKSINASHEFVGGGGALLPLFCSGVKQAARPLPRSQGERRFRGKTHDIPQDACHQPGVGAPTTCRVGRKVGELGTKRKYYSDHRAGGPPSQGAEVGST